jgi:magnesium transporter
MLGIPDSEGVGVRAGSGDALRMARRTIAAATSSRTAPMSALVFIDVFCIVPYCGIMIAYLKREHPGASVEALDHFLPGCWVNAIAPNGTELDILVASLGVEHDLLQDALDPSEAPRVQEDRDVLYLFVRVPYGDGDSAATVPMLIALGHHFLLTICQERLPFLERLFGGKVPYNTQWRSQLVLKLLGEIVATYQHGITAYSKSLRGTIANFGEIDNADILKLVASEGVLNDFLAALMPMHAMLPTLTSGRIMKMYNEDHDLIEDVQLAMGQVLEAANGQLRTTVNFRNAYSVVLTNNLNRIIKFLTLITVVLTVPMVVSGLYGMNVALPFAHHPAAFFIVIAITIGIIVCLLKVLAQQRLL